MSLLDQPKRSQQQHILSWNGAIADALLLVSLQGQESLSSPYCYQVRSMTRQTEAQIAQWHGRDVSCRVGEGNMPGPVRYVHGVVTRIQYARQGKDEASCIFTLEPAMALLNMGRMMRVWQKISVPDLVSELLRTHGISNLDLQLHGSYPEREYCIQYRESAFNFIQRLLEEEGIYYFFRHSESGHQLVLADHPASHIAISGGSLAWHDAGRLLSGGVIDSWVSGASLLPGGVEYHGYSMAQATAIDAGHRAGKKGAKLDDVSYTDITPVGERALIARQAEHAMAAREANTQRYQATSAVHWLSSGETFKLTDHPSGESEYRVQGLHLDIANHSEGPGYCHCQFEAMSNDSPWAPPIEHFPPEIPGVLLATVVGPASEEIHTDEYGRIKIQFPWDQESPADDTSSCWVQVAQSWVGGKFGAQFIPRVGSEVLVSFVQGHPDFPVVTGSVYNGQNKPPFALPGEKNESGFVTRSSTGGSVDDGHRLSFNDKKGEERLTIVAQKDLELTVKNEVKNTIATNRTTELTKGNDQLLLRQGDMKLVLEKGNWQQNITGNMATELKNGDYALKVAGGGGQVKTDKALSLESTQSIELKVGANKITLSASGISINGATLKLQASSTAEMKGAILKLEGSGTAELKGAMATVSGSGMAKVSGGITNIG